MSPFRAVLCSFCLLFFLPWTLGHYILILCFLFCLLFLFFPFLLDTLCCCLSFLRFGHFCSGRIFCLFCFFFLVLPCAYASHAIHTCLGGTWAPFIHTIFPNMICGGHVPTSASLSANLPPHTLAKIMSCGSICASVCLVLRLLGANASPCTHPNPCPPS